MEVTITSNSITLKTSASSVEYLRGTDISRIGISPVQIPGTQEFNYTAEILIKESDRKVTFALNTVSNKPNWTNDFIGSVYALNELSSVLKVQGSGGGQVDTIVPGTGISVDSTDPANPVVEMSDMPDGTFKGREIGAGTGPPVDLTPNQASDILDAATDPFVRTSNLPTGGDVVGPASATDNAITRFNLTTGKLIQNSTVLLDDNGKLGQVDAIDFNLTPVTAIAARRLQWNDTEGSLQMGFKGGSVHSHISEDMFLYAYNNSGSPMTKGQVVRVNGSNGTRPVISLAQADADPNSAETVGVVAETISNNSEGLVQVAGAMTNLNTNAFNDGDVLYLSPTIAGLMTNVKPSAPNHLVRIAYCIKKAGGAGIIYIAPLNGFELDELHDVKITTPATNTCGLYWNAGLSVWENLSPANAQTALGLGTLATQSGTFSGTSSGTNTGDQTITLTGDVTGSGTGSFAATIANDAVTYAKMQNVSATDRILGRSSAGAGDVQEITCTAQARALLDDATAADQRSTLGLGANGVQVCLCGTSITFTNQTNAEAFASTILLGSIFDTTGFTEVKLSTAVSVASASVNTPRIILKYNNSYSGTLGNYSAIGTSEVSVSMSTVGVFETAWIPLAAGAIGTGKQLRLTVAGGDGAADPQVAMVYCNFR